MIQREWQRIDPRYLDEDEQRYWASIAGRQVRFEERAEFVKKLSDGKASKACLEQFLATCAAENPNRRLRMMALADRVSMTVERADFDDLVTLVTQAPTWEKDRVQGTRILLRAIGEGKADAPEQILARWTWKLARATRKAQDRRASAEFPEAKRLLGRARELARAPARGERGEARERRARAAARGRRRAARLGRGLHAARDAADRGARASGSARSPRSRTRSPRTCRRPRRTAEGATAQATEAARAGSRASRRREAQTGQQSRDGAQPKRRRRRRKPARTDTAETTPGRPEPARAAEAS